MEEHLTLILNENQIKANKRKLASKSRYFASLFFHNFNDSHNKEHVINYDITLSTLQNFVEWIHDESHVNIYHRSIKVSIAKYMQDNFIELLNLLQLSILFMVDELTNDAIDIIVLCWLLPEKIIYTWLLAQELNIKILQDICLSVCLDRFEELPVPLLIELAKHNIIRLIENVNLRCCAQYLNFIRNEWMKCHPTSDIVDVKEQRQPKFMQGIVIYELCKEATKVAHLYSWDGNVLFKRVQFKDIERSGKWLIGMQVTSRGFSVYTVGGEMGLGTGRFNEIIWRYCLLSRKWYYQAKLPVPRRHMIAVFLRNKLVIVGGVGRHRLKLFTVDILDIHTGNWKKGAKVPETFTDVPPHCVLNGKLFLMKSSVYIYHPEQDNWQTILIYNNFVVQRVDAFLTHGTTLFLAGDHLGETVLSRISVEKDSVCEKEECLKEHIEHSVITNTNIVYEDDSYQLRYVHVVDVSLMTLNVRQGEQYQYLHLHTEKKRDFENSFIPKSGCFNIINPNTLYDTV